MWRRCTRCLLCSAPACLIPARAWSTSIAADRGGTQMRAMRRTGVRREAVAAFIACTLLGLASLTSFRPDAWMAVAVMRLRVEGVLPGTAEAAACMGCFCGLVALSAWCTLKLFPQHLPPTRGGQGAVMKHLTKHVPSPRPQPLPRASIGLRAVRRCIERSVPLKPWHGAVTRSHCRGVPRPSGVVVAALVDRFGSDPSAAGPVASLVQTVARASRSGAQAGTSHDGFGVIVVRRVLRMGWSEVPAVFKPFVSDERFLELHEDVVAAPEAGVSTRDGTCNLQGASTALSSCTPRPPRSVVHDNYRRWQCRGSGTPTSDGWSTTKPAQSFYQGQVHLRRSSARFTQSPWE